MRPLHRCLTALYLLCACMLSRLGHVQLFATLWSVAYQAPLSMGMPLARTLEWVATPPQVIFPDQGSNLHLLSLLCCQVGS